MARLQIEGLEALELSLDQTAELPWSVANEMLQAGGRVVASVMQSKYRSMLGIRTGTLAKSIEVQPKMGNLQGGQGHYVTVYPYGKHHMYHARSKTRTYKNSKSGRTYTFGGTLKEATNNDVAFVHEYGAPGQGITAKGIMRAAIEESADRAVDAEAQVYDNYLKSKNL